MLKVMLFDVDGVLVKREAAFSQYLARDYGLTSAMTAPFFRSHKFGACLVGQADLKQELLPFLPQWGWQRSIDEFLHYWFSCEQNIDEQPVAFAQQQRLKGIHCYLATNQEQYRTAYILEQMGFAQMFDGCFSSAHVGYMKPDLAFFEHILRTLDGVRADEILFWDDIPANVEAARQVGLHAEVYTDYEDFSERMSGYSLH